MGLAVITGGGRGIGAAISRRLAIEGHRILLTYNNDSQAAESVSADRRADGVDCVAAKVDCGDTDEVFILADHPWMKGGVDIYGAYLRHQITLPWSPQKVHELGLEEVSASGFHTCHALHHTVQCHDASARCRSRVLGFECLGIRLKSYMRFRAVKVLWVSFQTACQIIVMTVQMP